MKSTEVQVEGFVYHKLDKVPLQHIASHLQEWLAQRPPSLPSQMPVAWPQLSIVFCEALRRPTLSRDSILRFRDGRQLSMSIPQRESEMLFEQLLFVEYDSQFQQLSVYGSMGHAQYHSAIADLTYITVGDVCGNALLYEIDAQRAELLPLLRALRSDYILDPEAEYSLDEFVTATDRICQDVLKLGVPEAQTPLYGIATALANRPHEALGQRGAELIAAMHPPFREALLAHRRALLDYRLNLAYVFEAHRCFFANTWFPGHFEFFANVGAQMVCFPGSRDYIAPELRQRAEAIRVWHANRRPTAPYPGMLLSAPAQFLPDTLCGALPRHQKNVLFTHYELCEYLRNYLEFQLTEAVGQLQQDTGAAFARPIWSKVERRGSRYRSRHRAEVETTLNARGKGKLTTKDITETLLYREEFRFVFEDAEFDQGFLERYALPFVAEQLDGQFLDHPEWEQEPLLRHRHELSADATASLADSTNLPQSHAELVAYARERWPPCAVRLVEQCYGADHLKYRQRLIMAALMRKFGYSAPAGFQLWTALFSETHVAQQATVPFLETEQGRVIEADYQHNRQENLGIGCASMCSAALCPYGSGANADIEECQQKCTLELSRKTTAPLKYPLRAPVAYYNLYQKYGRHSTATPTG